MARTATETSQQLVDIHVHGAETYDTRTRRQDDILSWRAFTESADVGPVPTVTRSERPCASMTATGTP
jgi:hypothetical protein